MIDSGLTGSENVTTIGLESGTLAASFAGDIVSTLGICALKRTSTATTAAAAIVAGAEPVSLRAVSCARSITAPGAAAATYRPPPRDSANSGSVSTDTSAPANGSSLIARTTPAANPTGTDGRRKR